MLIFADKRIPDASLEKLAAFDELIPFETEGIVYESISGHPDVFMAQLEKQVIIAPNLPDFYKQKLREEKIDFTEGEFPVRKKHPETAGYNVVFKDNRLFHNFRYTDPSITKIAEDAELIHLNQAYTRCSLIALGNDRFISSDHGVERILQRYQFEVLYVDPAEIILPGQKHGFIGGCCGLHGNRIFFTGSLKHLRDGENVRSFCRDAAYEIIELSDAPLFDGGSILFVE